jgi:hypothetical protein
VCRSITQHRERLKKDSEIEGVEKEIMSIINS